MKPNLYPHLLAATAVLLLGICTRANAQTELIQNGGFESGSTGWTLSGGVSASANGGFARSGTYFAWFGGAVNENDAGYQTITIPANATAATLSFYYNINSLEGNTVANDTFSATIRNSSGSVLATVGNWSNINQDGGPGNPYYHQQTYNLLPYANQTIRIHFSSVNNSTKVTNFRVDDVSVQVTTPQNATLTVVANPSNGGSTTGSGSYPIGSQQTLTATANPGWTFTGWSDGNTFSPRTVTVPAGGATYTANFSQMATLTVVANPSSGGSTTGGGSYPVGSQQTLTAAANPGWTFTGWSDGNTFSPRTVTVPAGGATYTANFSQMAMLTVVANPANGGAVGGGGSYPVGSQQAITAAANPGWTFTGWSDGNTQSPRTVTVPAGGATYTANFSQMATLTVVASPATGAPWAAVGVTRSVPNRRSRPRRTRAGPSQAGATAIRRVHAQ